jgi:23S rRNA pseudouridine2605 synthase
MRLNKFLASKTLLSRRSADYEISTNTVQVNGELAVPGTVLKPGDVVNYSGEDYIYTQLEQSAKAPVVLLLNKPVGYVCSRDGQGAPTIYELLPEQYHNLNIAGRLDMDSCGLVVLTDDGDLLNQLTHPSFNKTKVYQITLDKPLNKIRQNKIEQEGVDIGDDRLSKMVLTQKSADYTRWQVELSEGRNRQIRRTFMALALEVVKLKRLSLGDYSLDQLNNEDFIVI